MSSTKPLSDIVQGASGRFDSRPIYRDSVEARAELQATQDVNLATIAGTLEEHPNHRYTAMGHAMCELRVRTVVPWTDEVGRQKERRELHSVVVWGKLAEDVSNTYSKGDRVCVEGRIQTRGYEGRDGGKKYVTEIVANVVFGEGPAERYSDE